jgi:predicted GTPase
VVNKLDVKWKERETELALADYYDLGIATVIGISAKNERNLTAIQDQIEKLYKQRKKEHPVDDSSFSGKMSRNEKGVT